MIYKDTTETKSRALLIPGRKQNSYTTLAAVLSSAEPAISAWQETKFVNIKVFHIAPTVKAISKSHAFSFYVRCN